MSDMRQIDENEHNEEVTLASPNEVPKEEASNSFGALKCYFHTPKRGDIRGAFCLLFAESGTSLDTIFWATRNMTGTDIDANTGWRELNKIIPSMGPYEKSLGEKLKEAMLDIVGPSVRIELLHPDGGSESLDDLAKKLRDAFERATHYFMEITLTFEHLSRQNLIEAGLLQAEGEEGADTSSHPQTQEEKSFSGTMITCLPVIDPVRGKPVSELVPGDLVNVKIQGGVGAAELIQRYLTSASQEAIFPVEGVLKEDNDKTRVLLNISEEVHGLITVTKDLRLSVVERPSGRKRIISFNADNLIFFGTLAVAFILILIAVRILFS
jgi:hypothetical protein